MHGITPAYLSHLLSLKPFHGLRSDHQMFLTVSRSNLISYGDRAFSHELKLSMEALPAELRICQSLTLFKSQPKTHLFS